MVRCYKRQTKHSGRGGQESIPGVGMFKRKFLGCYHNFVRQGRLAHLLGCVGDPVSRIAAKLDSPLACRSSASQALIGDSHNSFSEFRNSRRTRGDNLAGSAMLQSPI